jgi:hypothetical protein
MVRLVAPSVAPIVAAPGSGLGRRTEGGHVHHRHLGTDQDSQNHIEPVIGEIVIGTPDDAVFVVKFDTNTGFPSSVRQVILC